ncbi:hypothetical protein K469DRAFT_714108 [Zopfia rhizophila CBS 207.26]|uniref:Uncharacterized protein n=1 Tax=Zopfia rhizophila CBS 207.26 TaxID=1314779 RepID=A0A6A6DN00_9PEZI|nr:hypothetical protein K469DRAFT_714108 [Zopfia rhizophila CBS 207.26]
MSGKRQMVVADTARVTTSRGPEEPQIDRGAAPTVPTPLQTRKTSSNALMASTFALTERPPASLLISPPIRVLIIARPALLDSYRLDAAQADTELIRTFSIQTLGLAETDVGTRLVRHLITRIARHVWIIFDYGVPENSYKPSVAAFKILDGPTFSTIRFQRPGLEKEVNNTVEIWGRRTTHGAKFPSRTDLRKNQDARENVKH